MAKPLGTAMTDKECRRAGARDLRLLAQAAWQETARIGDLGKDRRLCGVPLGAGGRLEYEPRKGVYNPAHRAVSSCGDAVCPRCGPEVGWRRQSLITLALDARVRAGGFAVFVSINPRHHRSETAEAKLARIRLVTDWLPGEGKQSAGNRWKAANGVVDYVRVIEPSLGGWHGVNFGCHYLVFCMPVDGERPEVTAAELGDRLFRSMNQWVATRLLKLGDTPEGEALAAEWGTYLGDRAFHSRPAGVEQVARYMLKLADGPGIGRAAAEVTDPVGAKRGRRNISMRGYSLVVAEETVRTGYKTPKKALCNSEWVAGLAEQFIAVKRAVGTPGRTATGKRFRATKLFSPSHGLFDPWHKLPTDKLIELAHAVVAEADPAAADELKRLLVGDEDDDEDDESDTASIGYDAASRAFYKGEAEAGSVPHNDDAFFRTVAVDEDVGVTWAIHAGIGQQSWSVDRGICRMLDERGAFGGVVALRDATRAETGEVLFLHRQGDTRAVVDGVPEGPTPKLLVTNEPDVPGWDPLDWAVAEAKARAAPHRRRLTTIELARAS